MPAVIAYGQRDPISAGPLPVAADRHYQRPNPSVASKSLPVVHMNTIQAQTKWKLRHDCSNDTFW
jgi:hypothetical protein